ncbi:[citrate (pro-3S)-lyase] ligase [Thermanaerovibrio acidaminovorans]|jgi:[citrate (pro-3S)-lyase] ligase|uniref:Citrate lyase ligase n=1 Tax=Thermanaerovibrio acidaminovorans (strain ATCC 49978 / DSM 6589 / Su883) TaxID=525903 RepID=D1B796_THEAS|nr:[citrate (pro-3S)-lyase] ligase [Thermanaerovibrio acidaminovorans]ACZ19887.1 citrate lyase ligase [Thermanaerovibrio acidaminovorans DSM 6589]
MSFGVETEFLDPASGVPEEVLSLLYAEGLRFEGADVTVLLRMNRRPAATASLDGQVIKMVAVDPEYRSMGLSAQAVSRLLEWARPRGMGHFFVYTKPSEADKFESLGFCQIGSSPGAVLLEMGRPNAEDFRRGLEELRLRVGVEESSAIVMNANPFTRGHRYLAERASSASEHLFVVVVRSDRSSFPFEDRIRMVRLGLEDLGNVTVVDGGDYAVSSATFPTYFLRDPSMEEVIRIQTRLDLDLFGRIFVPALRIRSRFVGTEPYCPVTGLYNQAMREVLPRFGVQVVEVPRLEEGGSAVSASLVRRAMAEGDPRGLEALLPPTSYRYIMDNWDRLRERVLSSKGGH